jgi:hypothetical protein
MSICLRRREFHHAPRRIRDKCFKYKDNSGKGRGGCTPACTSENRRGGTWEDVGGLKVGGPSRRTAQHGASLPRLMGNTL